MIVSVVCWSALASAIPVGVDEITVTPGVPTTRIGSSYVYTGFYVLDVYNSDGTILYDNINSFCIDPASAPSGISYTYELIAVPDLAKYHEVAWLYSQVGTYGSLEVQRAIWYIMGMNPDPYNHDLVNAALDHSLFSTTGYRLLVSPRTGESYNKECQDYFIYVPEPGTLLLLGAGLLGFGIFRKRFA